MSKLSKEDKNRRFNAASEFLDNILDSPDQYPKNTAVFLWSDEELSHLFTKQRMKIVRKVSENDYESITELASDLKRDPSLVRKDLKLLEEYGIVKLEKYGNKVHICMNVEGAYVHLGDNKLEPIEIYMDKVGITRAIELSDINAFERDIKFAIKEGLEDGTLPQNINPVQIRERADDDEILSPKISSSYGELWDRIQYNWSKVKGVLPKRPFEITNWDQGTQLTGMEVV